MPRALKRCALTGCHRRKPKRQGMAERALAETSVEATAMVTVEARVMAEAMAAVNAAAMASMMAVAAAMAKVSEAIAALREFALSMRRWGR